MRFFCAIAAVFGVVSGLFCYYIHGSSNTYVRYSMMEVLGPAYPPLSHDEIHGPPPCFIFLHVCFFLFLLGGGDATGNETVGRVGTQSGGGGAGLCRGEPKCTGWGAETNKAGAFLF